MASSGKYSNVDFNLVATTGVFVHTYSASLFEKESSMKREVKLLLGVFMLAAILMSGMTAMASVTDDVAPVGPAVGPDGCDAIIA